jgi:hypothetical protein
MILKSLQLSLTMSNQANPADGLRQLVKVF